MSCRKAQVFGYWDHDVPVLVIAHNFENACESKGMRMSDVFAADDSENSVPAVLAIVAISLNDIRCLAQLDEGQSG